MLFEKKRAISAPAIAEETYLGPVRWVSTLLKWGGVCWVVHYLLQLLTELFASAGTPVQIIHWTDGLVFAGALVYLNAGLIGFSLWLKPFARTIAFAGTGVAILAIVTTVAGFAATQLFHFSTELPQTMGIISTCVSATLLATGALFTQALPIHLAGLLLLIGIFTFPLIEVMTAPLGTNAPFGNALSFAIAGAAWMLFSHSMNRFSFQSEL